MGLDKLIATISRVQSSQGHSGNYRAPQRAAQPPQYIPRQQEYAPPPPRYLAPLQPGKKRRVTPLIMLIIGALVVCGISFLVIGSMYKASFPSLKSRYTGELNNTTLLTNANIAFTFQQSLGEISGVYTETTSAVPSSSPLTGTIDTSGNIQLFIQTSNRLSFAGSMQSDGTLSGTFTTNNNGGGNWSASPA